MNSISKINFRGGESIGSIGYLNKPSANCPTCGGNVAFRGGESIGSIGYLNKPTADCPTCEDSVAFRGGVPELPAKKGSGSKLFLGFLATAIAAFGTLVAVGKKGAIDKLGEGRFKNILKDLKIDKGAKKCSEYYDAGVAKIKDLWSKITGKSKKSDAPAGV